MRQTRGRESEGENSGLIAIPLTESEDSDLVSSLLRQRPLIETFAVVQASFPSKGAG